MSDLNITLSNIRTIKDNKYMLVKKYLEIYEWINISQEDDIILRAVAKQVQRVRRNPAFWEAPCSTKITQLKDTDFD